MVAPGQGHVREALRRHGPRARRGHGEGHAQERALSTLLLHGFTGSAAAWGQEILGGLRAGGLDPIALDLPGHGKGPWEASAFTLEGALSGILDAAPEEPFDLVGYSMGARLSLALAVRYPERVRRLVLESGSPGLSAEEERAARRASDEELAAGLERHGIEPFVERWEALPLFAGLRRRLSAGELEAVHARRLSHDPRLLASALRGLGTGSLPSFWEALPELDRPVLLLAGAEDAKFVRIAREMAGRLPRASLRIVADSDHTTHLEQPKAWLVAVTGFLSG